MNITILCSSHFALETRVFKKEANSFHKMGHNVAIVAPYQKSQDCINGINIIGLPMVNNRIKRLLILPKLFKSGYSKNSDLWYCHELDSLLIGVLLKLFKGGRLVFDCHEYYPEKKQAQFSPYSKMLGLLVRNLVELYEKIFYRMADAVVVVNKHMGDRIYKRSGVKIFVIPNYPLFIKNRKIF